MYGKVFTSIFDGSLYGNFEATVVMMAMVSLADRDGVVDMTAQSMAARTGYPLTVIETGLKTLAQPDPKSRSKDEEGRRIVLLDPERDWGWRLVNYAKYRSIRSNDDRREYQRQLMASRRKKTGEEREGAADSVCTPVSNVSQQLAKLANSNTSPSASSFLQGERVENKRRLKPSSPKVRFPHETAPPDWLAFCRAERPDLVPEMIFNCFKDWGLSKGEVRADWFAAWRNWVRREHPPVEPVAPPRPVAGVNYV